MIYGKQHKLVSELRENLFMSIQSLPNWFSQVLQLVLNFESEQPLLFPIFIWRICKTFKLHFSYYNREA